MLTKDGKQAVKVKYYRKLKGFIFILFNFKEMGSLETKDCQFWKN